MRVVAACVFLMHEFFAVSGSIAALIIATCVLSLHVGYSLMNITASASNQHVLSLHCPVIPSVAHFTQIINCMSHCHFEKQYNWLKATYIKMYFLYVYGTLLTLTWSICLPVWLILSCLFFLTSGTCQCNFIAPEESSSPYSPYHFSIICWSNYTTSTTKPCGEDWIWPICGNGRPCP